MRGEIPRYIISNGLCCKRERGPSAQRGIFPFWLDALKAAKDCNCCVKGLGKCDKNSSARNCYR